MTTVTLTSSELRHSKAILLAADAGQWLRPGRLIEGRRAVGIPSQTKRGLYHWTDGHTCSCYDFRRRELACKHVIAHRLDAIARQQPQPASDTTDGLRQVLEQRLSERYAQIYRED
jgi:SWIM zinc finger